MYVNHATCRLYILVNTDVKGKGTEVPFLTIGLQGGQPRGVRFLGERYFLGRSSLGAAETEAFACCYFESTHLCRCFCIYFFCVFGREPPTLRFLPYRAVHLSTLCPVETMVTPTLAHLKKYTKVEVAGVEPASRTLFLPLHTAITFTYHSLQDTPW